MNYETRLIDGIDTKGSKISPQVDIFFQKFDQAATENASQTLFHAFVHRIQKRTVPETENAEVKAEKDNRSLQRMIALDMFRANQVGENVFLCSEGDREKWGVDFIIQVENKYLGFKIGRENRQKNPEASSLMITPRDFSTMVSKKNGSDTVQPITMQMIILPLNWLPTPQEALRYVEAIEHGKHHDILSAQKQTAQQIQAVVKNPYGIPMASEKNRTPDSPLKLEDPSAEARRAFENLFSGI